MTSQPTTSTTDNRSPDRWRIEVRDQWGIWRDEMGDPDANRFSSEDEAWAALADLQDVEESFRDGVYRVVRVER